LLRLFCAAAFLLAAAMPSRPADAGDLRQKAEEVSRNLDVQPKLPTASDAGSEEDRRDPLRWFPDAMDGPSASAPAGFWRILQWALLAIAVIIVVAWLGIWASETYTPRAPSSASRATPDDPAPLDPEKALALADEWAAAGRYAPAMHQVWLAAVAVLAPRLDKRAPDSLTNWELLRAANLQAAERQALRHVVTRVDRAWFGQQPAALEDYQAVRGSYQTFVAAGTAPA
jgi:uncharacterized protein DUF4129